MNFGHFFIYKSDYRKSIRISNYHQVDNNLVVVFEEVKNDEFPQQRQIQGCEEERMKKNVTTTTTTTSVAI